MTDSIGGKTVTLLVTVTDLSGSTTGRQGTVNSGWYSDGMFTKVVIGLLTGAGGGAVLLPSIGSSHNSDSSLGEGWSSRKRSSHVITVCPGVGGGPISDVIT